MAMIPFASSMTGTLTPVLPIYVPILKNIIKPDYSISGPNRIARFSASNDQRKFERSLEQTALPQPGIMLRSRSFSFGGGPMRDNNEVAGTTASFRFYLKKIPVFAF